MVIASKEPVRNGPATNEQKLARATLVEQGVWKANRMAKVRTFFVSICFVCTFCLRTTAVNPGATEGVAGAGAAFTGVSLSCWRACFASFLSWAGVVGRAGAIPGMALIGGPSLRMCPAKLTSFCE